MRRPIAVSLLVAACTAPDLGGARRGTPGPRGDEATPTDTAPLGDTAPAEDTGLVWSGDLAPYAGCAAGDSVKVLAQTTPTGPVAAGATVLGELVLANCEAATWIAATSEDAVAGVKLGSTSATVTDTWGRARVLLPADVPPSVAVRLRWTATAPLVNGPHPWEWRLVDEWVRWIGEPTPLVSVEVAGGYGPFTVHHRDEWEEPGLRVEGPDMRLDWLEFVTIHYNGVAEDLDGDDDVYQDADAIDRIRNTQEYSYYTNDGVSAGYNSYIALDGDEWEVRGHDIRNAASGCPDANYPGYTIIIPTVTPEAPPTAAQVEGAKAAIHRIREQAAASGNPNTLYLNGHRDVAPLCGLGTDCPGEPIYALLSAGSLEP